MRMLGVLGVSPFSSFSDLRGGKKKDQNNLAHYTGTGTESKETTPLKTDGQNSMFTFKGPIIASATTQIAMQNNCV